MCPVRYVLNVVISCTDSGQSSMQKGGSRIVCLISVKRITNSISNDSLLIRRRRIKGQAKWTNKNRYSRFSPYIPRDQEDKAVVVIIRVWLGGVRERPCNSSLEHRPRFLTTREAAWYIISVASVCIVCLSGHNFREPVRIRSPFSHIRYSSTGYGSSSYEGHRVTSRPQEQKRSNSRTGKIQSAIPPVL